MTHAHPLRERRAWIAVVSVLTAALTWLAVLDLALVVRLHPPGVPALGSVARAVGHALVAALRQAGPAAWALPLAATATALVAAAALIAVLFARRPAAAGGGLRHG